MVSIEKENAFALREYLHGKVLENCANDPFKVSFLVRLGLLEITQLLQFDFSTLPLYQKCAIAGLGDASQAVSKSELFRLLGQAAKIDNTPMQWVSDVVGVMAVKWLSEREDDQETMEKFGSWSGEFLQQQIVSKRLNAYEKDIAGYVVDTDGVVFTTASVALFFHYLNIRPITDHLKRQQLIENFMGEFRALSHTHPATLEALMIYVFDKINKDVALVPPNGWSLSDLLTFLENIPVGLKRWTWEEAPRTKGAQPVRWPVENEYHAQNLLYVLLGPIFTDVSDEVYLSPVGQKTPRIDLYLPSLHTVIEVKYRKDKKKSFSALIGEVAEDASLYRADPKYKDALIVSFLWDHTYSTQEHAKFKEGVMKLNGINGCIVVNAPSTMLQDSEKG